MGGFGSKIRTSNIKNKTVRIRRLPGDFCGSSISQKILVLLVYALLMTCYDLMLLNFVLPSVSVIFFLWIWDQSFHDLPGKLTCFSTLNSFSFQLVYKATLILLQSVPSEICLTNLKTRMENVS